MALRKKKRNKALSIIIVGAGKVGITLAEKLTAEGNNVTMVDKDRDIVARVANMFDIMSVAGNGSSYNTLLEAGVEKADLLIAVTDSDELNLLCCTLAKKVSDCASIARVRTPDYAGELTYLRDKLGISMIINPEFEAAKEIGRILHFPPAMSVNAFAKGTVDMVCFKLPEGNSLCDKRIMDIDNKYGILFCSAERDGGIHIPNGGFVLKAGDAVSIIGMSQNIIKFFGSIGIHTRRVSSAMIIGGGRTTFYLAEHLREAGTEVRIIESNAERCKELSSTLPENIIIVNGNGTDEELLLQENIAGMDAVIPLTGNDEENIILSLYARRVSERTRTVTKINHFSFAKLVRELDLGSVVYPRFMIAEIIITYVRGMRDTIDSNIETMYHLFDGRVEAIEFSVGKNAGVVNIPLRKLRLKDDLLVASVLRGGGSFIPGGDDCIMPGDDVVIVTTHKGFSGIEDILL